MGKAVTFRGGLSASEVCCKNMCQVGFILTTDLIKHKSGCNSVNFTETYPKSGVVVVESNPLHIF